MLKWHFDDLRKNKDYPIEFEEKINVKEDLVGKEIEILDASPVVVKGTIVFDDGIWYIDYDITGNITAPSTRSMKPVKLDLDEHVTEAYAKEDVDDESDEIVLEFDEDGYMDVKKSVIDNIILSVPSRILTDEEKVSNEMPTGKGWKVISESDLKDEKKSEDNINPELLKLKKLLKDDKKEDN